ncbi:hypothetical protein A3194_14140 [Candidatus Thiodiazotropha endoloripes]|uniref:transposase n=1 Tax=Candidatus Thiodiazotropha endoloripes TaxID=1818881 RepID=UPI00083CF400|nr:transposase [Candidatus Thiodiazotropha endoloripes]ODB84902.1 hypothetical protein A3194_14140 [Candidatus Thiodiazotropha endoloripes]
MVKIILIPSWILVAIFCSTLAHSYECKDIDLLLSPADSEFEEKVAVSGYSSYTLLERMKRKIDSPRGRHIYSQRLGTVEPVFGHINDAIGIKRFTLRGKQKVDGQWKLMMMLHNILKIHRYGGQWT